MNEDTDFNLDCQLPRDIETEQAILARAVIDSSAVPAIANELSPEDFYADDHQKIMAAIFTLMHDGRPADLGSIVEALHAAGNMGHGLGAYVGRLMDFPAAVDIPAAAARIKREAARRKIIEKSNSLMRSAQTEGSIEELRRQTGLAFAFIDLALDATCNGWKPSNRPPAMRGIRITQEEIEAATLTPRGIVRDYLYCDVATLSAPGGTGKTTITLYEMVCIILGRPLYGLEVITPGWCLFATAEDPRKLLIARLREIMRAMELTADERQTVMDSLLIWDVTGEQVRLIQAQDGNIVLTAMADDIIRTYRNDPPIMVVFDPIISFGAGESFVNDNEQGLVTAARRIMRGLGCCVRMVAHTGKGNAREKSLDQYTSRGGSALSDGARMVAVLQTWSPGDNLKPPPGCIIDSPGATITILARPKLSYTAPQPLIWIKRTGWKFEHFFEISISDEDRERALFDQAERFLASQVKEGVRHSLSSLETAIPNITRADARNAIKQLIARGRIIEVALPKDLRQGQRRTYLSVSTAECGVIPENDQNHFADETPSNYAAALRENIGGVLKPPNIPPVPRSAGDTRRNTAELAE